MFQLFLTCAVVGGTIFVLQFVLAVVGLGDHGVDVVDDVPDGVPHGVGDAFGDGHGDLADHGSTWLFGVISFRTVVAAMTFFGLAGTASLQGGQSSGVALAIGLLAGAAAMYGVHYLMLLLHGLRHDGTERIERSVGKRASVYIPIPANRSGNGKVQMQLQGRIVEYLAVTSGPDKLPSGSTVEVVSVLGPSTVEVAPVRTPADTADAND